MSAVVRSSRVAIASAVYVCGFPQFRLMECSHCVLRGFLPFALACDVAGGRWRGLRRGFLPCASRDCMIVRACWRKARKRPCRRFQRECPRPSCDVVTGGGTGGGVVGGGGTSLVVISPVWASVTVKVSGSYPTGMKPGRFDSRRTWWPDWVAKRCAALMMMPKSPLFARTC